MQASILSIFQLALFGPLQAAQGQPVSSRGIWGSVGSAQSTNMPGDAAYRALMSGEHMWDVSS